VRGVQTVIVGGEVDDPPVRSKSYLPSPHRSGPRQVAKLEGLQLKGVCLLVDAHVGGSGVLYHLARLIELLVGELAWGRHGVEERRSGPKWVDVGPYGIRHNEGVVQELPVIRRLALPWRPVLVKKGEKPAVAVQDVVSEGQKEQKGVDVKAAVGHVLGDLGAEGVGCWLGMVGVVGCAPWPELLFKERSELTREGRVEQWQPTRERVGQEVRPTFIRDVRELDGWIIGKGEADLWGVDAEEPHRDIAVWVSANRIAVMDGVPDRLALSRGGEAKAGLPNGKAGGRLPDRVRHQSSLQSASADRRLRAASITVGLAMLPVTNTLAPNA